jgi:hypothetical protein
MSRAKQASKRKSRACAVPFLGAAGVSLSLATGAPAATVGPVPSHEITLGEEEISDISLATFYVFDKENPKADLRLVGHGGGCGGHGHGGGCGGHGHGCGGHGHGCRGCGGCGGWWGGCGGCVSFGIGCVGWWGGCGGCSGGYWCWRNGRRVWCSY